MGKILYTTLTLLLGSALKRILMGAGIGLFTTHVVQGLISNYIARATQNMTFGASSALSFLGMCGGDKAIGILIGALSTYAIIKSAQVGIQKLSS
ncbi:DUF2523 domain-containing protein [Acinetobacter baumannii]|uniref:DUF2523 family protein n=1 Tax=Acinetobacter baumannii TaxID=470 RepID=UPI001C0C00C3|nr:DUF2523 family protein [Acinetobacter baumannii]MBU3096501.1 DUF2523 domain-containing protein [Acinetobacter baumannii]MDH2549546.1 DUF2523 family protein [Acinetobacter baumannii]